MISNTSFETNFQALPDNIQNKIKDYVPNVIDRTSQLQSNIKAIPEDIRNYIKSYVPTILDRASRNNLFTQLQLETDKKIGLYGENLILKGLHLCDQLFEAEKSWNFQKTKCENNIVLNSIPKNHWYKPVPGLFTAALNNPTESRKALNALSFINYGADEAVRQLEVISLTEDIKIQLDSDFSTISKTINSLLQMIRQKRNTEQTIYNACGGKDKFHDLKILPLEDLKDISLHDKIHVGESLMRGLLRDCPLIAISLQESKPLAKNLNTITLLMQSDKNDPTKWHNFGLTGLMHNDLGFVNEFGIKRGATGNFAIKDKDSMEYLHHTYYDLFPTVKQLLTTGSALYNPKNPAHGMFKLVKQG